MWLEPYKDKYRAIERYIDPMTGKTKRVSTIIDKDTKAARKAAESVLKAKIDKEQAIASDSDLTLAELSELYLAHQKKTVRAQSYKRDGCIVPIVTDLLGKDTKVNMLSARYITKCLEAANKDNVTLNTYFVHIRKLLRWGYRNDYIKDVGYLQKIQPYPDNKKERIEDKYLSTEELKKLLPAMKVTRWRLLTEFLALSGLRIGELMALESKDVTDVISINKTLDVLNGIVTENAKTDAGNRDVFIQPELEPVIREIRHFFLEDQMKNGYRSSLFFPGIQYAAYNKYLKETTKAILSHQITPHALRHTHVSLLAEAGVPLDVISRRVGHEDSSVTRKIYLHITEKQKEKDKDKLREVKIL